MAFGQPYRPMDVSPDLLNQGPLAQMAMPKPQMDTSPIQQAMQSMPQMAPQAKHGVNWLGVLADALSGAVGQPGMYAQSMMRQKQADQEEQTFQRHQDSEMQRQIGLYDYQRTHPEAKDPVGYAAELASMGLTPGTPEFNQRMTAHLNSMDDPLVTTTLPGDRVYSGPRSGLAAALSGASGGGSLPKVSDSATYNALPPGAQFIDPQGNVRTKGGQSGSSSTGGFR